MAKRSRGTNRPGQRHPGRPQPRPANKPAPILSADDETRAAELEQQIVARERAAEAGRNRSNDRNRPVEPVRAGRPGQGLLAAKAAEEYAYVVRDVRRIVVMAAVLVVIMAVLYVVVDVAHMVTIS